MARPSMRLRCRSSSTASVLASAPTHRASASTALNYYGHWAIRRPRLTASSRGGSSRSRPKALLHLALVDIGVAAVGQHRAKRLVRNAPVRAFADDLQVVVLHRELVTAELEVAAHALEVGGAQRVPHGVLVLDLPLHLADRGIDQERRVVARRGIASRQALVFALEGRHEFLVGGVVEVDGPVADAEEPEHRVADRADDVLVGAP